MDVVRIGSALAALLLPLSAAEAGPVAPRVRMSARAIPDFHLACRRYGRDHATVKNVGGATVPGGSRIAISTTGGAAGGPTSAHGVLHTALKPGAVWSSIAKLPVGFTACEAVVAGAQPL